MCLIKIPIQFLSWLSLITSAAQLTVNPLIILRFLTLLYVTLQTATVIKAAQLNYTLPSRLAVCMFSLCSVNFYWFWLL